MARDNTTILQAYDTPRLRICHIIEATAGGSARIAAQLIRSQCEQGAEVTLIYSPARADAWFIETVHAIPGLHTIPMEMKRAIGLHDGLAFLKLLLLLFKLKPFDIIHSHSSKAGALARIAGIFLPKTIQVYSPHAFYTMSGVKTPIYGWIEKCLSYFTDAIILVSPLEFRHARNNLGISESRLHTILNGIDIQAQGEREKARIHLGTGDGLFVMGFVGRLEEAKNPLRLIESFRIIASQREDIVLYIIGEGSIRKDTENLVALYGLQSRIRFITSNDARELIAGFDCLVCTSDYESFCLVMIEALAENVPVVTTPVGIAEIAIFDGQNGYIAGFEPEKIADSVLKLAAVSRDERIKKMQSSRPVVEKFNIHTMMQETYSLYLAKIEKKMK